LQQHQEQKESNLKPILTMIKHRFSATIAIAAAAAALPWTDGTRWGATAAAFVPHSVRSMCVGESSSSSRCYKTTTLAWRSITFLSSSKAAEEQQREHQQEVSHCVPLQNIRLDDIPRFGG
jgi:hypothetical protein